MAWNTVAKEAVTASFYEDRLPFALMGYLGNGKQRTDVLNFAKDAWDMLEVFEPLALKDPEYEELLKACLWPKSPFCREALISSREATFKSLGKSIETDLRLASGGPGAVLVENSHRTMNQQSRANLNGKLGRSGRWAACQNSGLLEDNEIRPPKPNNADELAAKHTVINNAIFDTVGKETKFTLGAEIFDAILQKDLTWNKKYDVDI